MQYVTDHVDAAFLHQPPPRALPSSTVWRLVRARIAQRRFAILDPWMLLGLVVLGALALLYAPPIVFVVPAVLIIWRIVRGLLWLLRSVRDDMTMLREGQVITAEVRKLRPHHTLSGNIEGALIDCEIPVTPRRTYVGSVWLADGQEALHFAQQGHVEVLCLPHVPGTWRIIEDVSSQITYQRVGQAIDIPEDTA